MAVVMTDLLETYESRGFVELPGLFRPDELQPLRDALDDGGGSAGAFTVPDADGNRQELSAWTELGDDLIGVLPRVRRMVDIATAAIGEPICHWHSKLSWKRPGTDAEWNWHQDYGFWAEEGVGPQMCTIGVAVGPSTRENGCLRVVPGSHRAGRIDLVETGETRCSSPRVVDELVAASGIHHCEMAPGDAVLFHSNLLHSSGPNHSAIPRTLFMSSYNAVSNPPAPDAPPDHAVRPLHVLPDAAAADGWTQVFGVTPFLDPHASGMDYQYSGIEKVEQEAAGGTA
jgi:hypothetical protein